MLCCDISRSYLTFIWHIPGHWAWLIQTLLGLFSLMTSNHFFGIVGSLNENSNYRTPCWLIVFRTLVKSRREQLLYYRDRIKLYIEQKSSGNVTIQMFQSSGITEVLFDMTSIHETKASSKSKYIKVQWIFANQYNTRNTWRRGVMSGSELQLNNGGLYVLIDNLIFLVSPFLTRSWCQWCHLIHWHLLENL